MLKEKMTNWVSHPRPQMKRELYKILNGIWKCNGKDIRVPFPPQSDLSGYEGVVEDILEYETVFEIPEEFTKERILLHFGAVDQICEVWVNEYYVGEHKGGYLPFSFDITEEVKRTGINQLRVKATDTLDLKYPYGKQRKKRGGMWYTPVSGIWQTVWLENVPACYIEKIKITPDLQGIDVETVFSGEDTDLLCQISLPDGSVFSCKLLDGYGRIEIENPRLWSPDDPYLYEMKMETEQDQIETYFALRKIEIKKMDGIHRVCLNEKSIFLHGVLDQGYFQDGIYLPAEEAEYEKDVERMKELGFNMLRKHIKVEPEIFYHLCDKLGMVVFQDMVNNSGYSYIFDTVLPTIGMKRFPDKHLHSKKRSREFFEEHMYATMEHLHFFPSVLYYTIFNEGWGQFLADEMYEKAIKFEPTRIIDATSGWFVRSKSDVDSRHVYFKKIKLGKVSAKPIVISEFGGYSHRVEGHLFGAENYGYSIFEEREEFEKAFFSLYENEVLPLVKKGICALVYTQVSDVEDETNGLITYDRRFVKVDEEKCRAVMQKLYNNI